ncbi:MAG: 4Fe-4S binding protein [Bacteroidetes bacterium]|nr:4Fe-4S binding protein [Bacteroidota bacterium]
MKKFPHPLKIARLVVATAFGLTLTLIFLVPGSAISTVLSPILTPLQLVPSVVRLTGGAVIVLAGLIPVLLLTILMGRVYCSTVCPLGILQDLVIRFRRQFPGRRWFRYNTPPPLFHYSVFSLTVVLALSGSFLLLNLLEPFSTYGRVVSTVGGPMAVALNNAAAFLLNRLGLPLLVHLPWRVADLVAITIPALVIVAIGAMAFWRGRLFCNTLCPAGALLGILSRVSIFRITVDHERCNECGHCERVCKAECIHSGSKTVDFAACVGCFNCIDACPTVGLSFEPIWHRDARTQTNDGRRSVLMTLIAPVTGRLAADSTIAPRALTYDESRRLAVAPPGAASTERFTGLCTACHLCVSACPTQVLYPSVLEYGLEGLFQPRMNYTASYCNFDCTVCGDVCPTGALQALPQAEKKLTQLGKAFFVREDCIVVTKKTDCGACSEHCPTKAVKMVPEGKVLLPVVTDTLCIGCGACEHACPTKPRKAIYVIPSAVHGKAQKPDTTPVQEGKQELEEFPF